MPQKKYFGTDGIRGRVGEGPISADFVLRLGWAAGRALAAHDGRPTVVIGKDTRISGYMFESALEAGLVAAGANVKLLGPMPTPGVAYLTRSLRADAGIVISASHNPHHDNGIKFFSALGEKLTDEVELAIEAALEQPFSTVASEALGKAARVEGADHRYSEFCKSTVPPELSLEGMRLALDCANGATYHVAPQLFAEMGADLIAVGVEPDGVNINRGCGSTDLSLLRRTVLESQAQFGVAFDGDGDRVMLVAADGSVVDGDDLLYLLAVDRQQRGVLRGPVVGTLMSNFGLQRAFEERGIEFVRARVGDRYVHQELRARGGELGGETSGHLLCLDKASTGDGIVNALQVFELLQRSGSDLATLLAGVHKVPQRTINVPSRGGSRVTEDAGVLRALEEAERALAGQGRVVLRPSGTEPVVRVTVEAPDEALLGSVQERLAAAVRNAA